MLIKLAVDCKLLSKLTVDCKLLSVSGKAWSKHAGCSRSVQYSDIAPQQYNNTMW